MFEWNRIGESSMCECAEFVAYTTLVLIIPQDIWDITRRTSQFDVYLVEYGWWGRYQYKSLINHSSLEERITCHVFASDASNMQTRMEFNGLVRSEEKSLNHCVTHSQTFDSRWLEFPTRNFTIIPIQSFLLIFLVCDWCVQCKNIHPPLFSQLKIKFFLRNLYSTHNGPSKTESFCIWFFFLLAFGSRTLPSPMPTHYISFMYIIADCPNNLPVRCFFFFHFWFAASIAGAPECEMRCTKLHIMKK